MEKRVSERRKGEKKERTRRDDGAHSGRLTDLSRVEDSSPRFVLPSYNGYSSSHEIDVRKRVVRSTKLVFKRGTFGSWDFADGDGSGVGVHLREGEKGMWEM